MERVHVEVSTNNQKGKSKYYERYRLFKVDEMSISFNKIKNRQS